MYNRIMLFSLIRFSSRGWKSGISLLLLCVAVSVIYYHIPWSFRSRVYEKAPKIDKVLMAGGYKTMQLWDDLALFGKDAAVPIQKSYRGDQAYAGLPSQGFKLFGRVNVLENRSYCVGYSESYKNPLWVGYRLFNVPRLSSGKRPSSFKGDARTEARVMPDDYTGSGYDRGHMAPNYGIATRYGPEAQKETFLMSNIIPQTPYVNRGIWKDLEMRTAKRYGRYFSEVWIITGPVFEKPFNELGPGVAIPSYYYKIIADERDGKLRTLAFLIDARTLPYTRLKKRLVSIDAIEERTGLDFFPDLPDSLQDELESKPATRLWPLLKPALRYHLKGRTD